MGNDFKRGPTEMPMITLCRCLPMINEKNIPEFLETSLIYMLSAVVAALGFFLVWLICSLAGFGGG